MIDPILAIGVENELNREVLGVGGKTFSPFFVASSLRRPL